jgi:hypothetical protein
MDSGWATRSSNVVGWNGSEGVVGVGESVGFGETVGVRSETFWPLFHMSFFLEATHVYFISPLVAVIPNFLHALPGLTAAKDEGR